VKNHKRLGKGLEDISHLFLSTEEKQRTSSKDLSTPAPPVREPTEHHFPRVVAVTGDHRSLEKSFLVSNLAIELARRGHQVRVLDADLNFPDQPFLWGLRPGESMAHWAMAEENDPERQVVLQGPYGSRLLCLDIDFSKLSALSETNRRRLLARLMAFEADARVMLVDTSASLNPNSRLIFQIAHQIVVLVPSDHLGMIDAYAAFKGILALRPSALLGMVAYHIRMVAEAEAVTNKMTQVVKKFLNSDIADLGFLFADLNIVKSILQRKPLVLSTLRSRAATCLSLIAERIMAQEGIRAQTGNSSFFASLIQALEDRP
jgi:flagellar biosynthesis protein FlhG